MLRYPTYKYSKQMVNHNLYIFIIISFMNRIILPLIYYSNLDVEPSKPILEDGLYFQIYSDDQCKSGNRYMNEFQLTVDTALQKDPNVKYIMVVACSQTLLSLRIVMSLY